MKKLWHSLTGTHRWVVKLRDYVPPCLNIKDIDEVSGSGRSSFARFQRMVQGYYVITVVCGCGAYEVRYA